MILKCLVVFVLIETVSSSTGLVISKLTYKWTDPNTGQTLLCEHCPPGSVVLTPCTSTQRTVCRPCINDQYIKYWNRYTKCRACYRCGYNEHETHPCNNSHDRVCQCDTDYFFRIEFCQRHAKCTYGHGVVITGTHYRDSTCAECPSGFFSPTISSTDHCIAHTKCTDGLVVNVPGNLYHDTLCTSCKKYVRPSVRNTACDDALIQFVAHQKIARRKLKRLLRPLTTENVHKLLKEMSKGNRDMMYAKLYPLLMKWKETVNSQSSNLPVAELMILILERAKLNNVVAKVQSRFW